MTRAVVLFDIDGTLIQVGPRETQIYLDALQEKIGERPIDTDWNRYKARTDLAVIREVLTFHRNRVPPQGDIDAVTQTYLAGIKRLLAQPDYYPGLIAGAASLVNALAADPGIGLALATANLKAASQMMLTRCDLWRHFPIGAFAEDGADKTEILKTALGRCRDHWGEAARYILIGDQPADFHAARENNIGFVGIARNAKTQAALDRLGVDGLLPDLTDIGRFRQAIGL